MDKNDSFQLEDRCLKLNTHEENEKIFILLNDYFFKIRDIDDKKEEASPPTLPDP